ncbi:MAG: permease, partial [Opitutales bacterium]|nr:permease [Opitutales bacterium]
GLTHVFLSKEWVIRHLGGTGIWKSIKATLLGVPLPICSCGVLPVAAQLRKSGAGAGPTAAFLASTPQTGVDSIVATAGMMGGVFALVRVIVAFVSGILSGTLVSLFSSSSEIEETRSTEPSTQPTHRPDSSRSFSQVIRSAVSYGLIEIPSELRKTLSWGMLAAAFIAVFLPDSHSMSLFGSTWLSYLFVIAVAVPIYVCSTGSIPIAVMLIGAGFSPGAALIFLVCGPATSVVNLVTISGFLGLKNTFVYLTSLILVALSAAWVMDHTPWIHAAVSTSHSMHGTRTLTTTGIVFSVLLLACLYGPLLVNAFRKGSSETPRSSPSQFIQWELLVEGMSCKNCARKVREALESQAGWSSVEIDVESGRVHATTPATPDEEQIRALIEKAGFRLAGSKRVR